MARTRSETKRVAILAAAIRVFAKEGLSAPTSAVSREAGVADGTLFIYFPTKAQLLDTVYRDIRLELAAAILADFPQKGNVRVRLRHIWDRFVQWGVEHPASLGVAVQIAARPDMTSSRSGSDEEIRTKYEAIHRTFQDLKQAGVPPPELVPSALDALAEMTIRLTLRRPELAAKYRRAGFELFWKGVAG